MSTQTDLEYDGVAGLPWSRFRCVIQSCRRKLYRRYKGEALWVIVRDITGHGSGVSREICRRCGLDPDQEISSRPLNEIRIIGELKVIAVTTEVDP